ncbi:MAG: hypothetical protein ACLSAF_07350 [Intestinimonas sp.]
MEGLNIRVQDSPVYLEMVEALGASATPVAFLSSTAPCRPAWWTDRRTPA